VHKNIAFENVELFNVKARGTYSSHFALKEQLIRKLF
jgi:hypothetical protein